MIITTKNEDKITTLSFTKLPKGQLDLSNIERLKAKFKKLLLSKNFNIVLDFYNIEYIDSSIIGCIVDLFNELRNNKGNLKLINVGKNIFEILEMTNLTRFLNISQK